MAKAEQAWRSVARPKQKKKENPPRAEVSATVPAWRPFTAGLIIVAGGACALAYGAVRGQLIYVLGALGLTLLIAGFVDGTGLRYRGAGTGLLFVFVSARLMPHLPRAFRRGVAYGSLVALYGAYVVVREWQINRAAAPDNPRSEPPSMSGGRQDPIDDTRGPERLTDGAAAS